MTEQTELSFDWSQCRENLAARGPMGGVTSFRSGGPRPRVASAAMAFLASLRIPEGVNAGKPLKLVPFQKKFIKGALRKDTFVSVLSLARGGGKSALSAGVSLVALLGVCDPQPSRFVVVVASTVEQGRIVFNFCVQMMRMLPPELQRGMTVRRAPRLEIEWDGDGGGHVLKVIAANATHALGSAPVFCVMDERGHWPGDRGDAVEQSLLTGLGKRGGRAVLISTSAPDDTHSFSRWIDHPPPGTYVQEHRPAPGLPADDVPSLLEANPGAKYGIGTSIERLKVQADQAIARGGSALTSFRLYNRNERISGEARDLLLSLDEWLAAEVNALPARDGHVVIGIDLGGSASMSAAVWYWPETGRLEAHGTFPSSPSLLNRGQSDGVSGRYVEMEARGELATLGDKTVPVAEWLTTVAQRVAGEPIAAVVADRYKQAELAEAMQRGGIRANVVWRGQGFRDGGEDCERFRRAVFDGRVRSLPSLLLRSAFADAVTLRDPANNLKLAKARSTGRIDAASAAVLAVAEGARLVARLQRPRRAATWA